MRLAAEHKLDVIVVMPQMSGPELAERLGKGRPESSALAVAGIVLKLSVTAVRSVRS